MRRARKIGAPLLVAMRPQQRDQSIRIDTADREMERQFGAALACANRLSVYLWQQYAAQQKANRVFEIDVTIDDPKAYTRPWTVRVNQRLLADTDLIEFVCAENERFINRLPPK
jgi:hypothetical protein